MRVRAAAIAVLALAAPASAGAATVELRPGGTVDGAKVNRAVIAAAPGETNVLTVTVSRVGPDRQGSPTLVTVHDDGALLGPLQGCAAVDAHTVGCQAADELGEVRVSLGDGNDRAAVRSASRDFFMFHTIVDAGAGDDTVELGDGGEVRGGPGNDTLTGSRLYDVLDGGAGNDVISGGAHGDYLIGGPGDDVVYGGAGPDSVVGGANEPTTEPAGNDRLYGDGGSDDLDDTDSNSLPAAPGADHLDGGPGEDEVTSYIHRSAPVAIDLATGSAGQSGEGDTLVAIEKAFGGSGDDVLTGDDGANFLDGRHGRDRVHGRGGPDTLLVGGRDSVTGDSGNDSIRTDPTYRGSLRCGSGRDTVLDDVSTYFPTAVPGPFIPSSCERLASGQGFDVDPSPVLSGGQLVFRVLRLQRRGLRMAVTSAARPYARFGTADVLRSPVRVPIAAGLATKIHRNGAVLRAIAVTLGYSPFAWRFSVG